MSKSQIIQKISVIGAGAWGTALATVSARTGADVTLWALEPDVVESINHRHENELYLKGIQLPESLTATTGFDHLSTADAILMVAPAQFVRSVLQDIKPHLRDNVPIVLCSKGIERGTGKLMTDVLAEECPNAVPAVLSGPSFAKDVAQGLPTAVTLACADQDLGGSIADAIGLATFRVYLSDDLIGAEVGGAVKNVLAIACGIVDGKAFGDSARAALIARGFAEVKRFAVSLGGKKETLSGLSGLGDLILTCSSPQSRNQSLGLALGQGESLDTIMSSRNTVAEGVHTAKAVVELARAKQIEMPISQAVEDIVSGAKSVDEAIIDLLSRPVGDEI